VPDDASATFDNERFEGEGFGSPYTAEVTREIVVTEPVPDFFLINRGGGRRVGYVDFRSFISTAEPELDEAFTLFRTEGVTELIVDLRYNGGGLLSVARTLGDLIAGETAAGEIFFELQFNEARSDSNETARLEPLPNSLIPARVIFITTAASASAREVVINGVAPHVEFAVVGETTFGKPVGQSGFDLKPCDLRLRPVTFRTVNALGEGGFFEGIPPQPTASCAAEDDLDFQLGDIAEASLEVALDYADTGTCDPQAAQAPSREARAAPSAAESRAQRYLNVY